jgi:hypothetical protein
MEVWQSELRKSVSDTANLCSSGFSYEMFHKCLLRSLWGNRSDLSLSSGKVESLKDGAICLVDDSKRVWEYLLSVRASSYPVTLTYILDNCGLELLSDLVLVYVLLKSSLVDVIYLHCKSAPVFVSDVICTDVRSALDWIEALGTLEAKLIVSFLNAALRSSKLQIYAHTFYTSPHPFWLMPESLRKLYASSSISFGLWMYILSFP